MAFEIFGSTLGSFAGVKTFLNYALIFFEFLLGVGFFIALFFFMLIKKRQTKIIEINQATKKIRVFNGSLKKRKSQPTRFWIGRLKKHLPEFQQKSLFHKNNQDLLILLKDNNGLHHTLRVPQYEDLRKWYMVTEGKDIATEKNEEINRLNDIWFHPTPHEDIDWLANTVAEADKEFEVNRWWQSPTIAYAITGFICFLMLMGTIVLST